MEGQTELFPLAGQIFKIKDTGWYVLCTRYSDSMDRVWGKWLLIDNFNDVHVYDKEASVPYHRLTQNIPLFVVDFVMEHLS